MANLTINDSLYSKLEAIVANEPNFPSVQAYVEYILDQVAEKKAQTSQGASPADATYSKEDEDKIRDRLKNLGYLD